MNTSLLDGQSDKGYRHNNQLKQDMCQATLNNLIKETLLLVFQDEITSFG